MGQDEYIALLHQRRHAQGIAGVFGKDEEGPAIGNETPMQGQAVIDGGHGELPDAVIQVIAVCIRIADHGGILPQGEVGAGQVSRTADQFRQVGAVGVQGIL